MEEDFSKFVRGFSITAAGVFYSAAMFYIGALVAVNLLGPKDYGLFNLAFMVPSVAVFFLYFGLDVTAARYIAHNLGEKNEEKALRCAQTILVVRLLVAVLSMFVFFFLSEPLARLLGEDIVLGLQWFSVYIGTFMVTRYLMAIFQGYFLLKERTIIEALVNTMNTVLIIPLVYLGYGYLAPILAMVFTIIFSIVISVYYLEKARIPVFKFAFEGFHALKEYLQFSFYVYLSDSFHTAYVWIGTVVIAFYSMPVETVGYYRAMYSITNTVLLISYGLTIVLYPMLSELNARKEYERLAYGIRKVIKYTLALSIPSAFGTLLLARPLVSVLFPKYMAAVTLLEIFSFRMIFLPLWAILATALLILERAREQALLSVVLCILNLVLSLFFGLFSVEGIAFANTVTLAVVVTLQYIVLKRRVLQINAGPVLKFCFASFVMCGVVWLILQMPVSDVVKVILSLLVGVIVYSLTVLIIHAVSKDDLEMMKSGLSAFGRAGKSLEPILGLARMIQEL